MSDYSISITVDRSAAEAFRAITAVRGWWFGEIAGSSEQVGDEFTYQVTGVHWSKQQVTERVPDQRIAWRVIDSELTFSSAQREWTGTTIEFALRSHGKDTTIVFTHRGLVPAFACHGACSNAWATLIDKNLRRWIETGEVQPSPR